MGMRSLRDHLYLSRCMEAMELGGAKQARVLQMEEELHLESSWQHVHGTIKVPDVTGFSSMDDLTRWTMKRISGQHSLSWL